MFKPGDKVRVKRDIYRVPVVTHEDYPNHVLYSKKNDSGEIVEIFYAENSAALAPKILHAKVLIENQIKTFRLSSIEKVNE